MLWADAYVNSIIVVDVVVVVVVSKTSFKFHICCYESMPIQTLYVP